MDEGVAELLRRSLDNNRRMLDEMRKAQDNALRCYRDMIVVREENRVLRKTLAELQELIPRQ